MEFRDKLGWVGLGLAWLVLICLDSYRERARVHARFFLFIEKGKR